MQSVGVPSVLLANEVVDVGAIAWIGREASTDLACWVDSVEGVELLADGLAETNAAPLRVLVEVGHRGGRTGARSPEAAIAVADAVARRRELTLAGVAGYEGTIGHERTTDVLADVDGFLGVLAEVSDRIAGIVDGPPILSAGGSLFFDRVAALAGHGRRVVLRSGCTITHDHGLYERGSPFAGGPGPRFRPAIEAWGSVLSRPEPEVAVIGLGKRDVPSDIEPPIPVRMRDDDRSLAGMRVERLMDQHAICRVPAELSLGPGEVIAFGISHPCAAFDRRRVLFELDDDDRVVGAIATVF
jgi:D-serine deaminase-like pyridoxal phosphate-dependent protein